MWKNIHSLLIKKKPVLIMIDQVQKMYDDEINIKFPHPIR